MIDATSTLEQVCFEVSQALESHGIAAVLCGGSAATVYAPQAYQSYDADFVLTNDEELKTIEPVMMTLGFKREGRSRIFCHPQNPFTVDFPKGPLGIGAEYVRITHVLEKNGLRLHIVTRTDCVRDRLSHFYFWNDYTALNAAVAVASANLSDIGLDEIRAWTEREDPKLLEKFAEFERRLTS